MLKTGDVLVFGPLGKQTSMTIRKSAAETNGKSFELEMEMDLQTGGPPVHLHPYAIETYQVLQGQFDVYVNGVWRTLATGENIVVAKSVPHTFRNAHTETTRVYNTHQPALKYDAYFQDLHKLAQSGVVTPNQMTFKAHLYQAVLQTRYADENRLAHPPYPIMQLLGFIGRLMRYEV